MRELPIYHVNAFAAGPHSGNPAAVVPLAEWLPDEQMLAIAAQNNLSETAFYVAGEPGFDLRWFTPATEVKLCGHATLATAFVLFEEFREAGPTLRFRTRSGPLDVSRAGELFSMNFPRWALTRHDDAPAQLLAGLGVEPSELYLVDTRDNWFVVLEEPNQVRGLVPDARALAELHPAGVVVTAPGWDSDCVCRYFAPSYGVPEDPGTGSVHCGLIPYWAQRLGTNRIHSLQLSVRGAEFFCELEADRTVIKGRAHKYLEGRIWV